MAEVKSLPAPPNAFAALPGVRQVVLLVGVALSIALAIAIVLWARGPGYSLLYSQLSDRDAGEVVQALQTANIPYRLTGSSIQVPAAQVHDARLQLASQGLPHGTGRGLELIEEESSFGVSELMEGARYQYMLETELARTISNLQPVENARVHLALPKQSVFVRDREQGSASVMVQLYPGRSLEESQVAAVVHLIASSVPNLAASAVTVVDQHGRLLTMPDMTHDMELTAQQFEHMQHVGSQYAHRIETLLASAVGLDRVRANVTVDMDFTISEQTNETFDSAATAVRSEHTSTDQHSGSDGAAAGIPGALSNQPPEGGTTTPPAPAPAAAQAAGQNTQAAAPTSSSRNSTTNYEVPHKIERIQQQPGTIRRISAAVVIDNWQRVGSDGKVESVALSEDELARFTTLAREAVGFDEKRGDSVNVVNVAFHSEAPLPIVESSWYEAPLVQDLLKQGLGALLVLGVLLVLVRPIVRNLLQAPLVPALSHGGPALLEAARETPALVSVQHRMAVARSVASEDPRRVAQVVKNWMSNDA